MPDLFTVPLEDQMMLNTGVFEQGKYANITTLQINRNWTLQKTT